MPSSYPHLAYMHSSQPIILSLWDASQMFEYATSRYTTILAALEKSQVPRTLTFRRQFVRYLVWEAEKFVFPLINICATSNVSPCLPEYLNDVIKMLTEWHFQSSDFEISGDLMVQYQMVTSFEYCWWKDRFDLMPFQMPERLALDELKDMCMAHMAQLPAAYMMIPDSRKNKGGSDPLLTNLRVLRDDLEELGTHLQSLIMKKTVEGRIALQAMAHLEGPVDNLQDIIAASQRLLESDMMEEDD
ncbi:hypothetical protein P692DRAFT_20882413 [Suillus brevipes Sb2]|nr:hypothetical protein P692DRAFT_20882413 [Suillus brevipes Sb2]